MVQYYPPRITFKDIEHILCGEFGVTDLAEQERLDDVEERKRRGKGTPKKAKSKGALELSFVLPSVIEICVLIVLYRRQQTCSEEKTINDTNPSHSVLIIAEQDIPTFSCTPAPDFSWRRAEPILL